MRRETISAEKNILSSIDLFLKIFWNINNTDIKEELNLDVCLKLFHIDLNVGIRSCTNVIRVIS